MKMFIRIAGAGPSFRGSLPVCLHWACVCVHEHQKDEI
jgi:hypothetical protein